MLTNAKSTSPSVKDTAVEASCSPENVQEIRRFPISGLKNNDHTIATDVSLFTKTKIYDVSADGACMYRAYLAVKTRDRCWLSRGVTSTENIRDCLESQGDRARIVESIQAAFAFLLRKADPNILQDDGLLLEHIIINPQMSPRVNELLIRLVNSNFSEYLYSNTIGKADFSLWNTQIVQKEICLFANIKREDIALFSGLFEVITNLISEQIIKTLEIPINNNLSLYLRSQGLHYDLVAPADFFAERSMKSYFIRQIKYCLSEKDPKKITLFYEVKPQAEAQEKVEIDLTKNKSDTDEQGVTKEHSMCPKTQVISKQSDPKISIGIENITPEETEETQELKDTEYYKDILRMKLIFSLINEFDKKILLNDQEHKTLTSDMNKLIRVPGSDDINVLARLKCLNKEAIRLSEERREILLRYNISPSSYRNKTNLKIALSMLQLQTEQEIQLKGKLKSVKDTVHRAQSELAKRRRELLMANELYEKAQKNLVERGEDSNTRKAAEKVLREAKVEQKKAVYSVKDADGEFTKSKKAYEDKKHELGLITTAEMILKQKKIEKIAQEAFLKNPLLIPALPVKQVLVSTASSKEAGNTSPKSSSKPVGNTSPKSSPNTATMSQSTLKTSRVGAAYLEDGSVLLPFSALPPIGGDTHYNLEYQSQRNAQELAQKRSCKRPHRAHLGYALKVHDLKFGIESAHKSDDKQSKEKLIKRLDELKSRFIREKKFSDEIDALAIKYKPVTMKLFMFKQDINKYVTNLDFLFLNKVESRKERIFQARGRSESEKIDLKTQWENKANVIKEGYFGDADLSIILPELIKNIMQEAREQAKVEIEKGRVRKNIAVRSVLPKRETDFLSEVPSIDQSTQLIEVKMENIEHLAPETTMEQEDNLTESEANGLNIIKVEENPNIKEEPESALIKTLKNEPIEPSCAPLFAIKEENEDIEIADFSGVQVGSHLELATRKRVYSSPEGEGSSEQTQKKMFKFEEIQDVAEVKESAEVKDTPEMIELKRLLKRQRINLEEIKKKKEKAKLSLTKLQREYLIGNVTLMTFNESVKTLTDLINGFDKRILSVEMELKTLEEQRLMPRAEIELKLPEKAH